MKIRPKKRRESVQISFRIARIVVFVVFALYAFSLLYPVLWGFLASLKEQAEYSTFNRNGLPQRWLFSNYVRAFQVLSASGKNMLVMLWNSIWYTVGGTLVGVAVSSMVAYVCAKYRFFGNKLIYFISLLVIMIPIIGAMPSQYRVYTILNIIDSPMIIVSFASGFGFNFIVLYGYFKALPWAFAEAGYIDGAGDLRIFLQLMLPQAFGVITALCVVGSIKFWNDYMGPLLFLKSYPTLMAGLYIYQIEAARAIDMPLYFAGVLMSMLPILLLFIFFQNTLMDMSVAGGLKG